MEAGQGHGSGEKGGGPAGQERLPHQLRHAQATEGSATRREEQGEGGGEKAEQEEGTPPEYEFTAWEDRMMEVVMESMRMAGLALAMRAIATICLGAPEPWLSLKHIQGCTSLCTAVRNGTSFQGGQRQVTAGSAGSLP